MTLRRLSCLTMALSLALSAAVPAWSQNRDGREDRDNRDDREQMRQPSRGQPQDRGDERYQRDRRDQRDSRDPRDDRWRGAPAQRYERGAGPDHSYYPGSRLPAYYRNRQYVVEDWRGHHLQAPPRGYQWVQTGGDYVLVAIATGVILQLLLGQ